MTVSFLLSLPLDLIDPPFLGRAPFERKIINKAPRVINDDIVRSGAFFIPNQAVLRQIADNVDNTTR